MTDKKLQNTVVYVGRTASTIKPTPKPYVVPEKWKPLLNLAYAYTTNSINEKLIHFDALDVTVAQHTESINQLLDDFATLSNLNNDEFINLVNELGEKIEMIDPDLLLGLAYTYTLMQAHGVYEQSYAYTYIMYEDAINRSYARIDSVNNSLTDTINSSISNITNDLVNNYVQKDYADSYLALKSEIPSRTSQLENDSNFITSDALSGYATSTFVEERISNVIDNAPEALDTLREISYALNNDPNLGTTLTNQISQKADTSYVTNLYNDLYNKTISQREDIPIYDEAMKQAIIDSTGSLPDKYISLPTENELMNSCSSGRYLDIIFGTLRALQDEVTRLKNTFDKGIISMVNEQTHMTDVVREYVDVDENEPLWAIDPASLTEISGAEFYVDNAHILIPNENVTVMDGKLTITNTASWFDNHPDITSGEPDNYLHDNEDAKQYVYITTSNPNIVIRLTNYVEDERFIDIDLRTLNIPYIDTDKYNILLCVSRSVKYNTTWKGMDFIFLSVHEYYSGEKLAEGYYLPSTNTVTDYERYLNSSNNDAETNRFYISRVQFTDTDLYRMTFYSKYQDFSNDVQPTAPSDDTYSVAHITIRSVKNIEQLKKIKNQLLENELIYNDSNNCIYIIKNNEIKLISGGSVTPDPSEDITGMERSEIIEWLESNGIIGLTQTDDDIFDRLSFNSVGEITFINELGKKYKFKVDSNGELKSTLLNDKTLEDRLRLHNISITDGVIQGNQFTSRRGFVGTLGEYESGKRTSSTGDAVTSDLGLYSDRIKIGNIYAPWRGTNVYGCTHGYIELENSSDKDFELDGCYIHFAIRLSDKFKAEENNKVEEYSLPLNGIIPAGGTYLIRCKKYSDITQSNTFINVDSYDIEWITPEGKLLDLYLGELQNTFLLTYKCPGKDWAPTVKKNGETVENTFDYSAVMTADAVPGSDNQGFKVYHPCYIDSVSIFAHITESNADGTPKDNPTWCGWLSGGLNNLTWAESKGIYKNGKKLDALYKTTFELDPAKQAYQALYWDNTKASGADSSRVRTNTATDYQTVYLQKEFIEFPKSDIVYPVAMYTPMASYLHKNVCSDKTKLDMEKPNCVTVSFGINMFTTKCFNWVSAGEFDEYVWIRQRGTETWSKPFESYKERSAGDTTYNKYVTDSHTAPYRKEFTIITNNAAYARIKKTFPGSGVKYTAHKCIIEIVDNPVGSKATYEYVVGRADKNKKPDLEHTSKIMEFTMYPSDYEPRLYQTTDQQGFHWIEYQTWSACAKQINEIINTDIINNPNIIPVILNTGDATQNGTRYNEWLDYYLGGECLFNHLEQMSIVGNNDLCGNDPEILGTGDDIGKSNGFYHHVFYCYEVDERVYNDDEDTNIVNGYLQTDTNAATYLDNKKFKYLPLIKGNDNVIRFIPSFYWFGTPDKYTFMMMNSELTYINCGEWFKRKIENGSTNQTVNLYTGWSIINKAGDPESIYDNGFTTIYTMLYNIIQDHIANKGRNETDVTKKIQNLIVACHEMPFTVVTGSNLKTDKITHDRSVNNNKSLVGSHMNKMHINDNKSNYWFSRLLEYFNVKFVYGGHKHTYAITNELRENYLYVVKDENDNDVIKSSIIDGKMTMPQTLEGNNDTATFKLTLYSLPKENEGQTFIQSLINQTENSTAKSVDGSKFPIMNVNDDVQNNAAKYGSKKNGVIIENDVFYPYYGVTLGENEDLGGVIYMMCQATGFKLKSNKELPGQSQRFSFIIPKTKESTVSNKTDTPSNHQLEPMFTKIYPNEHKTYLIRLLNIHYGDPYSDIAPAVLTQDKYGTDPIVIEYLHRNDRSTIDMYGAWTRTETQLLSW